MKRFFLLLAVCSTCFIAFAGGNLRVVTIGDTSMASQEESQLAGWADKLTTIFAEDVEILNLAEAGKSTQQWLSENIWSAKKVQIQRGDFVLVQFCDIDIVQSNDAAHASIMQYTQNLEQLVKDIKKRGGKAIICTPVARRYFSLETGELVERHGGYVEAARRVAKANKLPLLDLNQRTFEWLQTEGEQATDIFFAEDSDMVLSEAGAEKVVEFVADEIANQKVKKLIKVLK